MISNISLWAERVIIAVIIGTIIEMILPKGNSKKYIKTVIGIYILYVIISPVISFATGNEFNLGYSVYDKYFTKVEEYRTLEEDINNVTNNAIETAYKEEMKKKIKNTIEKMGFFASRMSFNINLKTGGITNLNISVDKEKELTHSNTISIDKIKIGNTKEMERENDLSRQEIEKIKENLNGTYGIEYEEISINSI